MALLSMYDLQCLQVVLAACEKKQSAGFQARDISTSHSVEQFVLFFVTKMNAYDI